MSEITTLDYLDISEDGEFRLWECGGYEDCYQTVSKQKFIEALKKKIEHYQTMLRACEADNGTKPAP